MSLTQDPPTPAHHDWAPGPPGGIVELLGDCPWCGCRRVPAGLGGGVTDTTGTVVAATASDVDRPVADAAGDALADASGDALADASADAVDDPAGGVAAPPDTPTTVSSPERAAELLVPLLAARDREACVVALLDTRHRVRAVEVVSIGSLNHTFMAPREVYRAALLGNAAALVVAHNHPSGDPTPSSDDVAVTTRLARAGDLMGVDLLDHLVVAGHAWESLARHGHV